MLNAPEYLTDEELMSRSVMQPEKSYIRKAFDFFTGGSPSGRASFMLPGLGMAKQPMTRLYRGEPAKALSTRLPKWVNRSPEYSDIAQATGRWFTDVPEIADWYLREAGSTGRVSTVKVPRSQLEKYQVQNIPEARRFSGDPEREFFLPSEIAETRKPARGFQRLLEKRGMKPAEVPGRAVGPMQELPESANELEGLLQQVGGKYKGPVTVDPELKKRMLRGDFD